jgi:copper(I)-binding protein
MKMDGSVMRMRELKDGLALPARQTVELKPGGNHVMLMDLKQPLAKGSTVPLRLRFEDAKGTVSVREVQVPVGAPEGAGAGGHVH